MDHSFETKANPVLIPATIIQLQGNGLTCLDKAHLWATSNVKNVSVCDPTEFIAHID